MKTPISAMIYRSLKAFALWGYGWKRRKQRASVSYRFEWQDPATGHWYGEKAAVRLMKAQVMSQYGRTADRSGNYRSSF